MYEGFAAEPKDLAGECNRSACVGAEPSGIGAVYDDVMWCVDCMSVNDAPFFCRCDADASDH